MSKNSTEFDKLFLRHKHWILVLPWVSSMNSRQATEKLRIQPVFSASAGRPTVLRVSLNTNPKKPRFFVSPDQLRSWFEKNHDRKREQWIGFYKKATGRPSITWPESVDQALCFGWIDGIRKSIDDQAYMIRFTPRRPKSNWSAVNLKRVPELKKAGLMTPAGIAAYQRRDKEKTNQYAYEKAKAQLPPAFQKTFRQNRSAWQYFQSLPPSVRQPSICWVITAKQESTRIRRLEKLIHHSSRSERLPQFISPTKKRPHSK